MVRGSRGRLGTTPLKVTMPGSTAIERLWLELPGYERATYAVRPTKSAYVFVELEPARLQLPPAPMPPPAAGR